MRRGIWDAFTRTHTLDVWVVSSSLNDCPIESVSAVMKTCVRKSVIWHSYDWAWYTRCSSCVVCTFNEERIGKTNGKHAVKRTALHDNTQQRPRERGNVTKNHKSPAASNYRAHKIEWKIAAHLCRFHYFVAFLNFSFSHSRPRQLKIIYHETIWTIFLNLLQSTEKVYTFW